MNFFAPNFLYLLPLVILPLIFHFIFRFRLKKIDFSSLFFLIHIKKERFHFYRLKDLLLLILRTVFIFFLMFSLARPYLIRKVSPIFKILPQRGKSVLIILDDSYSMEYQNNFDKGKKIVREIIKNLPTDSKVTILLTSKKKVIENEKAVNISDTMLANLKISYDISYAQEILEQFKNFDGDVYLITDLQEHSYSFLNDFESSFLLKIIDLGKENFENCGIVDFCFLPEREGKINLQIKLANYSQRELEIPISFYGRNFYFKNFITLPPGIKNFNFEIPKRVEENIITGRVEIEDENLKGDNFYYFVYEQKKEASILVVYAEEADIVYFKKIFSTIKDYQVNYLPFKEIKRFSLFPYYLVFLVNPTKIDNFLKWQLSNYLKSGGKVILILGRVLEENTLEEVFETSEIWKEKGFLNIDKWEKEHFIFREFGKKIIEESKFYQVINVKNKNLKVLANFNNNFPFLLEDTLNNLLIFTTNFVDNFTDLPIKTFFLPLIYRVIEYYRLKEKNNFFVGETIRLNLELPYVEIFTPWGNFLRETSLEKGKRIIKFFETKEPGIYQFADKKISVNVRSVEGNLKKLNLMKKNNLTIIKEAIEEEYEITYFLLFLALLVFLIEVVLLLI